jgi:TolB-like protein
MNYFRFLLPCILIFVSACATSDHKFPSAQDQRVISKDLDLQMDVLAGQLASSLEILKIRKIAFVEFPDLDGNVTDLGRFIAEELTTRLVMTNNIEVVERSLLKKIMEEQKLSATGLIDDKSAVKFGRITGAAALVTGTIADLNTGVKVNARVIASETGIVYAGASAKIPMSREIEGLLGKHAGKPVQSDSRRFDGAWNISIACTPRQGVNGYVIHINAEVKDGVLHGQYGTDSVAPCLTLEGKINPDGSAMLSAKGLTGDPQVTLNNIKKGTPYSYHIESSFSDYRGTGNRIEQRVCNVVFIKQ